MSEQNIASIVDGVEEIYRNNRRHGTHPLTMYTAGFLTIRTDVTETLTKLIVDGISSHSMHLDQYVVLHAAFVSALHKLVGIEFGERSCSIHATLRVLKFHHDQRHSLCSM